RIKEGFQRAKETIREEFAKTREAVHDMSIMGRVYGRLHWDKALNTSDLNLKVESGTVTLRGEGPCLEAQGKAVTLAKDTVGVGKVVDELTVRPQSPSESKPGHTTTPSS